MTLLSYALLTSPDPLQAGATATLTLIVSNPGHQAVTVQGIVVTLPVGTNARDLTGDPTGLEMEVPDGWQASPVNGEITLTPWDDSVAVAGEGLLFIFAGIGVNAAPGTCSITVDETASTAAQPVATGRVASIGLVKFP
ncbi:MAG TPA: hypothetical protein VLK84_16195, partial [Longimicrobium sp.]|nr:hypothetical protein [Longimicrobium sp.]